MDGYRAYKLRTAFYQFPVDEEFCMALIQSAAVSFEGLDDVEQLAWGFVLLDYETWPKVEDQSSSS